MKFIVVQYKLITSLECIFDNHAQKSIFIFFCFRPPVNNNPNYENKTTNCMNLANAKNGELFVSDSECAINGTGGICRKDKRPYETKCPASWYLYEGRCYKITDFMGTQTQAVRDCEVQGGRLASARHRGILVSFIKSNVN